MRLDLNKKPEGIWVSFNESCGKADGKTREFKIPIPPTEARDVLVMRGFEMMVPDGRLMLRNDKDGTLLKDDADGYAIETRPGEELWVVFDRPPALGQDPNVSGLGRQVGDAFKVLPMSDTLQRQISEAMPENIRRPKKREDATDSDQIEAGRLNFMTLVVDWMGMTDSRDQALLCDEAAKKAFLGATNAQFFGVFVRNRSLALQKEQIQQHKDDVRD